MEKKDSNNSNILGVIGLALIVLLLAYTMIDENPPEEYIRDKRLYEKRLKEEAMKDSISIKSDTVTQ